VEQDAELIQPQSGESKRLHHLRESDSQLKPTGFQEKSGPPKSSIFPPRLALWAERDYK
jgi:hypothetical protein